MVVEYKIKKLSDADDRYTRASWDPSVWPLSICGRTGIYYRQGVISLTFKKTPGLLLLQGIVR